jgi:hypothetical protein
MNPENKAKSIYNDYYLMILAHGEGLSQEITISILAKKSALIAVNEIIKAKKLDLGIMSLDYKYWVKVKQEIEKL